MNLIERTIAFITGRKASYMLLKSPGAKAALADLAKFCRANESTYHPNPQIAQALVGRREVWLRIQEHLNLSPDELFELYAQTKLEKKNG